MRPYSSVKGFCGLSYTYFPGTWVLGQFGETGPEHPKTCTKTSAPHLTSNDVLLLCQGHLRVQLYLSYGYSSIRTIWGNRVQIPYKVTHEK